MALITGGLFAIGISGMTVGIYLINRPNDAEARRRTEEQNRFEQLQAELERQTELRPQRTNTATVSGWKKVKVLGEGGFGKVWLVEKNGDRQAMKEVRNEGENQTVALRREIEILENLNHRNIVKYHGYAESGGYVYMFLELMDMSIRDKLDDRGYGLPEETCSFYTAQILDGLVYLHGKEIIHRDIKCANLLLDDTGDVVKLADMGISKHHDQETLISYKYKVGTYAWMSPEVISRHEGGRRSDIWSLGCTVYEMLELDPPFFDRRGHGNNLTELIRNITSLKHKELVSNNENFSRPLKDFLGKIFVIMGKRPYAAAIAGHAWLK